MKASSAPGARSSSRPRPSSSRLRLHLGRVVRAPPRKHGWGAGPVPVRSPPTPGQRRQRRQLADRGRWRCAPTSGRPRAHDLRSLPRRLRAFVTTSLRARAPSTPARPPTAARAAATEAATEASSRCRPGRARTPSRPSTRSGSSAATSAASATTRRPRRARPCSGGIQNSPSTLYRLLWNATTATWASTATDGWNAGKVIHYPDGTGTPDAEGVTRAERDTTAIYVSTERNGDAGSVSRLSVLRFDTSTAGRVAERDPRVEPDRRSPRLRRQPGPRGDHLDPRQLPGRRRLRRRQHRPALRSDALREPRHRHLLRRSRVERRHLRLRAGSRRPAPTIASPRSRGPRRRSWICRSIATSAISGATATIPVETARRCSRSTPLRRQPTRGHFVLRRLFDHPSTLPNANNEGIAIAPESECTDGQKPFYWADDSATGGNSIRTRFDSRAAQSLLTASPTGRPGWSRRVSRSRSRRLRRRRWCCRRCSPGTSWRARRWRWRRSAAGSG